MTQKTILLLGAGFVSTTVIEYLTRRPENFLYVVSRTHSKAQQQVNKYAHNPEKQTKVVELDVEKDDAQTLEQLTALVEKSNIVISLVPYTYHVKVAQICIAKKVNMITTSYISEPMKNLDEAAKQAGISIMNEIGVDPGTDHLAAVKIIKEVHDLGGSIDTFYSWCGGLPALGYEGEGNPIKYKFSWSPLGVLKALSNNAKFLEDGQEKVIPSAQLMKSARDLKLHPDYDFQGYPNRDSTPYQSLYFIPEAKTVLRGTLRHRGFCQTMDQFRTIGLLDYTPQHPLLQQSHASWAHLMQQLLQAKDVSEESLSAALLQKLNLDAQSEAGKHAVQACKWLGLFSQSEKVKVTGPMLVEALANLLADKCVYGENEVDMTFLQHIFECSYKDGKKETRKATLLLLGDKDGRFSSMAKGTGLPCAVSTQMILDGTISQKGVFGPMEYEMNLKILELLAKEKLEFVDEIISH